VDVYWDRGFVLGDARIHLGSAYSLAFDAFFRSAEQE